VRFPSALLGTAVSVTTTLPDPRRNPMWVHDNWPQTADRGQVLAGVTAGFVDQATLSVLPKAQVPHSRELRFTWQDGRVWRIRLDEGFGFMRVAGPNVTFRFDQLEADQTTALQQAKFSVEGRIATTVYVFGIE